MGEPDWGCPPARRTCPAYRRSGQETGRRSGSLSRKSNAGRCLGNTRCIRSGPAGGYGGRGIRKPLIGAEAIDIGLPLLIVDVPG